jgi:FtsH-binding integral membrane protein
MFPVIAPIIVSYLQFFFVRKVYGILTVQLLITIAFIAIFLFSDGVKKYAQDHIEMWAIAFVLVFIVMIVFVCFTEARRQWPLNIILLCVFTLCQGFFLGSVSATYDVSYTGIKSTVPYKRERDRVQDKQLICHVTFSKKTHDTFPV